MVRSKACAKGSACVVLMVAVGGWLGCSNEAEKCERTQTCPTSSTGNGGAGGGGGSPAEMDCTNGLDDDNDGSIDCDDTDCEPGYSCVPAMPSDVLVVVAQSCEAGTTDLGWLDCSACPCDPVTGTCAIDADLSGAMNCGGATYKVVIDASAPMGCDSNAVFTNMGGVYVKITNVVPTVPSTASCGVLPNEVNACQIDKVGSCAASGNVCAPKTLGPICMVVADGAPCPADYPNAITLQEGGDCGCSCSVDMETCPVSISLYGEAGCMGTAIDFSGTLDQCAQSTIANIMSAKAPPSQVTCSGTAMPTGGTPKTVCCLM